MRAGAELVWSVSMLRKICWRTWLELVLTRWKKSSAV